MFTGETLVKVETKFKEDYASIVHGFLKGNLPNDFQRDHLHTLLVRKANELLFDEGITEIKPVIVITVNSEANSMNTDLRWRVG